MQLFRTILTALALGSALFSLSTPQAIAQNADSARSDEAIVDIAQAYKQRDRKRMAALLGQVRGSSLEPWAVYWELSSRLDTASKTEIQTALGRIAGTYQEDRLRAEWLLQLGRNRDWATFDQEYRQYRMGDERALQCYALWSDYANNGADVAKTVQDLWLSLREGDEACAGIAEQLIEHKKLPAQTAWIRARLGKTTACVSLPKRLACWMGLGSKRSTRFISIRANTSATSSPPCALKPARWYRWL
jgi:soluble lytic murein transglycosylase